MKALRSDADAPASFESFPWVEITEFQSWQEVASLGARLFDVSGHPSALVGAWVRDARTQAATPEALLLRAARFVQDEVRYVAIEVGMSRRRPDDPDTVLSRRYGDCKDKTALLVALLRAGGVNAWPALVSSSRGQTLDGWAPSPQAFDHAIVKAVSASGEPLWIDPTLSLQGGGVDRFRYAPFERALVLDRATSVLETLHAEPAADASPFVRDRFHLGLPGGSEETTLETERTYRGRVADMMRAALRMRSQDDLRDEVRQRYQQQYPAIRNVGPPRGFRRPGARCAAPRGAFRPARVLAEGRGRRQVPGRYRRVRRRRGAAPLRPWSAPRPWACRTPSARATRRASRCPST